MEALEAGMKDSLPQEFCGLVAGHGCLKERGGYSLGGCRGAQFLQQSPQVGTVAACVEQKEVKHQEKVQPRSRRALLHTKYSDFPALPRSLRASSRVSAERGGCV